MRREASIPLFLWVATAALAHLIWGGGAEQGARLIDERLDVGRFAAGIRSHVRNSVAPPIEIAIEDESAPEEQAKPEEKPPEDTPDEATPDEEEDKTPEKAQPEPEKKAKVEPKPEEKPEPEKKKDEPEKKEPEKKVAELLVEPKPLPKMEAPKKISVRQQVEDEHQKDNPDAQYLADKANRVKEETVARITSTDQDAGKTSPGSAPTSPAASEPGNAEETHVRQDSDQAGDKKTSPGGSQSEQAARASAGNALPRLGDPSGAAAPGKAGATTKPDTSPQSTAQQDKDQAAKAATPENPGSPDVMSSESGSFAMNAPQAATKAQKAQKAKKRLPPRKPRSLMDQLGLGAAGVTPGGVALNLTPKMAVAAIGTDEMSRLKHADSERRKSAHRGAWKTPSFERYRSAIENYVPSVKPGNQTALNTAAAPFASYLNQIHSRIHPIFADEFLGSLDSLPASHPMNDPTLVTVLEIVVEREEGRLVRRGMTRTSGVTAFDINAIAAVDRAGPFGTPPSEIVSPDGNVYLHWEFRRDGMMCSTLFAHPYIINVPPKPAPLPTEPPKPPFRGPDDETAPTGERHGLLQLAPGPAKAAPEG